MMFKKSLIFISLFVLSLPAYSSEKICKRVMVAFAKDNNIALSGDEADQLGTAFLKSIENSKSNEAKNLKKRLAEQSSKAHKVAYVLEDPERIKEVLKIIKKSLPRLEAESKAENLAICVLAGMCAATEAIALGMGATGVIDAGKATGLALVGLLPGIYAIEAYLQNLKAKNTLGKAQEIIVQKDPNSWKHFQLDADLISIKDLPGVYRPYGGLQGLIIFEPKITLDLVVEKREDGSEVAFLWVSTDLHREQIPGSPKF